MTSFTFEVFPDGHIQFNEKRFKTNGTHFFVKDGRIFPTSKDAPSKGMDLDIHLEDGLVIIEDPIGAMNTPVTLYKGKEKYVHVPHRRIYCYEKIYCYFEDYVKSFREALRCKHPILFDDMSQVRISSYHWNFFLQHPGPYIERDFLINTEQLTRYQYFNRVKQILDNGVPVIDYSPENLHILRDVPGDKFLLPYQYHQGEVDQLKQWMTKEYDVVFVGTMGPSRVSVLNQLEAEGVKVHVVTGFGEDRDKELMKGKLLLNIHYDSNYGLYESIRCDRLIFAGMLVVTEKSEYQDQLDIKDLLIIDAQCNLAKKVKWILDNYEEVNSEFLEKRERLLPGIIENRKEALKSLDKHLKK